MKLRHKFGCLALIFVIALSVNLVMSSWCIYIFFRSAFVDIESSFQRQAEIGQLRAWLIQADLPAGPAGRQELRERISAVAPPAEAMTARAAFEQVAAAADGTPAVLDEALNLYNNAITEQRQRDIEHADRVQRRVVTILLGNAAIGCLLCVAGLILVRRWVLVPVADLRVATRQIGSGNFDYRIQRPSSDELGQLACEVNQMSATIVDMQSKMVEQERLAAAGEMMTRVAHNIRNPLAGIRGLAEAAAQPSLPLADVAQLQQKIIETVDRFEVWLRELQHSVAPMQLNVQPVDIQKMVADVQGVLLPMAERRGVRIESSISDDLRLVPVDPFHFEQALVALATNAVQFSASGALVRLEVARDTDQWWQVAVVDEGPGVPPALQQKIFLPYYSTRRDGHGIGLALAAKVVRTHGGQLSVQSVMGRGSRFVARMPLSTGSADPPLPREAISQGSRGHGPNPRY